MVKKFALGLTKKGVQEAKDFIDDVFPLGTFADKLLGLIQQELWLNLV